MDVFRQFKGDLLAADESPRVLEGNWEHEKVVIMSFENQADCLTFLDSPQYQAIAVDRKAGADTVALLVQGLEQHSGTPAAPS